MHRNIQIYTYWVECLAYNMCLINRRKNVNPPYIVEVLIILGEKTEKRQIFRIREKKWNKSRKNEKMIV